MKKHFLLAALCLTAPSAVLAQKFEGLALTPPMGWNTWNTFAANIDEKLIRETAEAMIANGMRDAGYVYIVMDDAWMAKERDAAGNLVPDPVKFPSGLKALGDFLHSKGFKFGIYNCAGAQTCGGYPGGRGHEYQDALAYASWGVDYLKYDWCFHGTADAQETYKIMRDALYTAKRPVVFSLCEWGGNKPWTWAKDVGHLWRTTGDITDCYDCQKKWSRGWKIILDSQVDLFEYAGPGHWNDPDMLEVGNRGLTFAESRAHFSLWCMLAAPLMAGNDVRHMTSEIQSVLTDKGAIAIDQDVLGKQAQRWETGPLREIWVKQLEQGQWAVCILNTSPASAKISLSWSELSYFFSGKHAVHDIWQKIDLGTTDQDFSAEIASHDVALLRLTPFK